MDDDTARTRLKAREAELTQLLDGDHAAPVELDQSRVGRLSRMDALAGQAMAAETKRRRRAELSRVRAALRRIDAGQYGSCPECGETIAERRLAHDPAVVKCIDCARAAS